MSPQAESDFELSREVVYPSSRSRRTTAAGDMTSSDIECIRAAVPDEPQLRSAVVDKC